MTVIWVVIFLRVFVVDDCIQPELPACDQGTEDSSGDDLAKDLEPEFDTVDGLQLKEFKFQHMSKPYLLQIRSNTHIKTSPEVRRPLR